jgi:diguanylate cyclase (GGDEF)-like protein/PAS domain S-box-containing protein
VPRHLPFAIASLAALAITAEYFAWVTFVWGGLGATQAMGDIVEFVVAFMAAAGCFWGARRLAGRQTIAWRLIGLSAFAWGCGEVAWSFYELVAKENVPFPSLADLGFLAGVPFALAGVLMLPRWSGSSALRTFFDGLIIAGSLFAISWATSLGSVYRAGADSVLDMAISVAYPLSDVAIATVLVLIVSRSASGSRLPLTLLTAGLFANLLADSAFAFLTAQNSYGIGGALDTGWVAGFLLIGLAGLRADWVGAAGADKQRPSALRAALPHLPLLVAVAIIGIDELHGTPIDPPLFWSMIAVVLVLVVRQLLVLVDNLRLSATLEAREEYFRSLVQNSSDVILLIDQAGRIAYAAPSLNRILGHRPEEVVGSNFESLIHPEDRQRLLEQLRDLIDKSARDLLVEGRISRRDGGWSPCDIAATNLLGEPGVRGIVVNARDVTERKLLEKRLVYQAYHDSLTDLPNRAAFQQELDGALQRGRDERKIAVLYLDLDEFKDINDNFGHQAGDAILKEVADRLRKTVRPTDAVARLGGDEFAILLRDVKGPESVTKVIERIDWAMRPAFMLDGREHFLHASIGNAGIVSGQEAADELLRNADASMYEAKAIARNRRRRRLPGSAA